MTCVIATPDKALAMELKALVSLVGMTVVDGAGDLLLLDADATVTAPVCQKVLRFSRNAETGADFVRPFFYRDLLKVLKTQYSEHISEGVPGQTYFPMNGFTATEKRLLDVLMDADGAPISSAELAQAVFGNAESQNELKVYIRHLRQKIEEPQGVRVIETVRGVGYRFRADRVLKTQYIEYAGEGKHG